MRKDFDGPGNCRKSKMQLGGFIPTLAIRRVVKIPGHTLERLQLCINIPSSADPFVDTVANARIDHAFVDMICCRPRLSTKVSAGARGMSLTRRPFVIGDSKLGHLRKMRRDGYDIRIEVYEWNTILDVLQCQAVRRSYCVIHTNETIAAFDRVTMALKNVIDSPVTFANRDWHLIKNSCGL
ncbi:uncharacterized protein BT62DRAFT_1004579 [Guyanagaster necrorhizus]|uniref:Uncharacterized protein n=1 Tax=Guyanagaster necrorhizus TaxID=856835 RepID=A0A9P7VWD2_9AGAR|nr:uncharacterized protein BT62DRAFT_1004579 [Guyanagaster necrorhizus MCA 3950]KAG7447818.1 hypothetical protein BT62DRAFT_1004579 [Guyanagaster necrorhizus MCA 3950]